jgi:hypothetical protein
MVVVSTNAVGQPNTVMIVPRNTSFAETAVLTSCWFQEVTRTATMTGMKNHSVIWIPCHLILMVFVSDVRLGDNASVQKDVRKKREDWHAEPVES